MQLGSLHFRHHDRLLGPDDHQEVDLCALGVLHFPLARVVRRDFGRFVQDDRSFLGGLHHHGAVLEVYLHPHNHHGLLLYHIICIFIVAESSAAGRAVHEAPSKQDREYDICYSNLLPSEKAQLLPCGHEYHKLCIEKWVADHKTCPLCRARPRFMLVRFDEHVQKYTAHQVIGPPAPNCCLQRIVDLLKQILADIEILKQRQGGGPDPLLESTINFLNVLYNTYSDAATNRP